MDLDALHSHLTVSLNQLVAFYSLLHFFHFNIYNLSVIFFFLFVIILGKHLVSVGGYIYLWDWRIGMLLTKLKASSSCSAIASVSFSSDGKFVVTAGKKHLKFWAIGSSAKTCLNKGSVSLAIHGKAVNLGPQKESSYISIASTLRTNRIVTCGRAEELFPIYTLTDAGWGHFPLF